MQSFFVHAMKGGSTGVAPLIHNLDWRWKGVVNIMLWPLYPREISPVQIEQEAVWARSWTGGFRGQKRVLATKNTVRIINYIYTLLYTNKPCLILRT